MGAWLIGMCSLLFLAPLIHGCGFGGGMCGCGRKKRSISELPDFGNLAGRDEDLLCNSPDLKQLLRNHVASSGSARDAARSSADALRGALEALGERFVVLCTPKLQRRNESDGGLDSFAFALPHEAEYCSHASHNVGCHIFADPRHISSS